MNTNKINIQFVHPISKMEAVVQEDGSVMFPDCDARIAPTDGIFDLSILTCKDDEREHYDAEYVAMEGRELADVMSFESLRKLWHRHTAFEMMYELTDIGPGGAMLLIGNGASRKEFSYLEKGAYVVYTDLSIRAVRLAKKVFGLSAFHDGYKEKMAFHAIDGLNLPFASESFDVIYGCAFVHHLRDLPPFFAEVHRCLKPGGSCVFFDEAYIGWWQKAKATILKPVQLFSHWRTGISPEDRYATRRGGYRKDELEVLLAESGFEHVFYERRGLFEHLFRRGSIKLLTRRLSEPMARVGRWIDRIFGESFMKKHGFNLVWGARK